MVRKRKIDFGFIPSIYQEDIFDFVQHGAGNAVISALAGSGKTLTAVSCLKLIPKTQKCLFIAFNKSIVDTLIEKPTNMPHAYARTMHSLGFLMIKRNLGNDIEVNEYKYRTYIKAHISELTSIGEDVVLTQQQINNYIDNIIALTDFARFNVAQSEKEINEVANKYEIPIDYDEVSVVKKVLKWGRENTKTIDYTDMVWLPTELSLKPIGLQYDWIMFDECQDASIAYIKLFMKCFKKGTRFIAVGDKNQSINKFAGSSPEAFEYLCNYPNTKIFELPITYRCPVSVVNLAKEYVKDIQAREEAPIGNVLYDCSIKSLKDGDMVLARTKAPLLNLYTKLLKRNVKCYIKGSDIGLNLINLLDTVDEEMLYSNLENKGVFVRLYDRLFDDRNKMMRHYGLTKDDATLTSQIMEKYDTINCLLTLSEKLKTKKQLIDTIRKTFKEENSGIMLSTVHKAKGLEANNVYILCRSSMPSKLAKSDIDRQQEENLIYVAITRPKQTLGFISEKEIKPSGSAQEPLEIINELNFVEKKVCELLGKQPTPDDDNIEIERMKVKQATKIDETSLELPENTIVMENKEKTKPSEELLSNLKKYLEDGGDMSLLTKYLS